MVVVLAAVPELDDPRVALAKSVTEMVEAVTVIEGGRIPESIGRVMVASVVECGPGSVTSKRLVATTGLPSVELWV